MSFKVVVYCHDRNEVIFERTYATWRWAHKCAVQKAKQMHINTSILITDNFEESE